MHASVVESTQRRTHPYVLGVLALTLALILAGCGGDDDEGSASQPTETESPGTAGRAGAGGASVPTLEATLSGRSVAPARGDGDGQGTATLTVYPGRGEICTKITVTGIEKPTAAHIHQGAGGAVGPVFVSLDPAEALTSQDCKTADRQAMFSLFSNPRGFYVDVHNRSFPKGAVRGQLQR